MKIKSITLITVLTIMSVSCGQQQSKAVAAEMPEEVGASLVDAHQSQQPTVMTDEAFNELLREIIYKLPASVMPEYLQTEEQRRESEFNSYSMNRFSHNHEGGEGSYSTWEMNGYLTEDQQNVVLFVEYSACYDGCNIILDTTLNHNRNTQRLTGIERPIELPTVDEMVIREHFDSQQLYEKAKEYFSNKMEISYSCGTDGLSVELDYMNFLNEKDFKTYIYDASYMKAYMVARYKWNGKRFEKYLVEELRR